MMRGAARQPWNDTGAGAVLVITVIGVLTCVAVGALAIGQFALDRSRAATAADLGALAAAEKALAGDQCGAAERVVGRNSASVERCAVEGLDVIIEVSVEAGPFLARVAEFAGRDSPRVHAVSRAGPPTNAN